MTDFDGVAKVGGRIAGMLVLVVVLSLLMALPVMALWNWVLPDLTGAGTLTFMRAWGMNLLCSLLFKANTQNLSSLTRVGRFRSPGVL